MFALDSGSSQFKGDDGIMNTILGLVNNTPNSPNVELVLGYTSTGEQGTIVVPPSLYNVEIQAGQGQGQVISQFQPLGLDNLVLVGSVLMDYLYTIFEYSISKDSQGNYSCVPVGMWLFNKTNGAKLIQSKSSADFFTTKTGKKQS
jgi:saccharopepsin